MITRRGVLDDALGVAALSVNTAFVEAATPHVSTAKRDPIMEITRNGAQPSSKESAEYFTWIVRIDPLFQAPDAAPHLLQIADMASRKPRNSMT